MGNSDSLPGEESLLDFAAFMDAALLADMAALRELSADAVYQEGDEP